MILHIFLFCFDVLFCFVSFIHSIFCFILTFLFYTDKRVTDYAPVKRKTAKKEIDIDLSAIPSKH